MSLVKDKENVTYQGHVSVVRVSNLSFNQGKVYIRSTHVYKTCHIYAPDMDSFESFAEKKDLPVARHATFSQMFSIFRQVERVI